MSSDNYNVVAKDRNGKWRVWLNLSASCNEADQLRTVESAAKFDGHDEAIDWAEQQGYTEYGTYDIGEFTKEPNEAVDVAVAIRVVAACPCLHTTPCHDTCTCVNALSSSGCRRCCTYGSAEQRVAMAKTLASFIDDGWRRRAGDTDA